MKKKIIRKIITNQKLLKYSNSCYIKFFFKKISVNKYGLLNEINVNNFRTTKYTPICQIQGRFKKSLKIFQFSRHIIRENTYKNQFSSLTSNI